MSKIPRKNCNECTLRHRTCVFESTSHRQCTRCIKNNLICFFFKSGEYYLTPLHHFILHSTQPLLLTFFCQEQGRHRGRGGALASLEAQGYTGEGGTRSASTEFARRGGEACSAIYSISGKCKYPGCKYAISSGEFCVTHYPPKPEKSDKCRVCGRVLGMEKGRKGACNACYCKPEAIAARKKATAEKKAA